MVCSNFFKKVYYLVSKLNFKLELRRIGEMYYKNVIALAGHLHGIHNEVQVLKARHLSFRREILNDNTNIFQLNQNPSSSSFFTSRPDTTGPNPFLGLSK